MPGNACSEIPTDANYPLTFGVAADSGFRQIPILWVRPGVYQSQSHLPGCLLVRFLWELGVFVWPG